MKSVISRVLYRYRGKEGQEMILGSAHSCASYPINSCNSIYYESWEQYCYPCDLEQMVSEYFEVEK